MRIYIIVLFYDIVNIDTRKERHYGNGKNYVCGAGNHCKHSNHRYFTKEETKMKNNQKSKRSKTEIAVSVSVDTTELDIALEKANRLMEILQEAERLRDSIFNKDGKETRK